MRGRKVKSGYFERQDLELGLGEVGDPDRAGAGVPSGEPVETRGHDVGHQPLDLVEVGGLGQRQVQRHPLDLDTAVVDHPPHGVTQAPGGEAVAQHRGHPLQGDPRSLSRGAALVGQRLQVLEAADRVDHPRVERRVG